MKNVRAIVEKSEAHQIEDLQRQLREKDALLELLVLQISQMKASFHSLVERTTDSSTPGAAQHSSLDEALPPQTYVGQVPIKDDEGYFSTYAHFDIHLDMLSVS